jgi:hypothetical protein
VTHWSGSLLSCGAGWRMTVIDLHALVLAHRGQAAV